MKLLIIDGNSGYIDTLVSALRGSVTEIESALDGKSGLGLARKNKYDCIVLDTDLPDMNGLSLIRTLRDEVYLGPIIILTEKDMVEDKIEGLERGADDYLVKPCDHRELFARIRNVLRRISGRKRPLLNCGELLLDPVARECKVEDHIIPLRKREFDILELLMKHENQVFSREKIIAEVWQKEYDGTSNVVDVHIKYLRDKLRPFNLDSVVVTVRGVGYKVSCPG